MEFPSDCIIEVDLAALDHNLKQVRAQIGDRQILAVVKADAYGHGAVAVSKFLLRRASVPIAMLCVADVDEALSLRAAGIRKPILLLTGCPAARVEEAVQHRLTPVVFDRASLLALGRCAAERQKRIGIHIKIDTGMGRLGVPVSEAAAFFDAARAHRAIRVEGILSHLADADDRHFTRRQIADFKRVIGTLNLQTVPPCHIANSAATLTNDAARFDAVRPGLALYGYLSGYSSGSPSTRRKLPVSLRPVMRVRARILMLKRVPPNTPISYGRTWVTRRESQIAVVAIGYADGYPRALSNRGEMCVRGRRAPVVGRVCMDMTMIDVTGIVGVSVGDWVTVLGQDGSRRIGADDLADRCDTIAYEILCRLGRGSGNPRVYLNGDLGRDDEAGT